MIKRIRFATRSAGITPEEFRVAWRQAVARLVEAPVGVRPVRLAVSTVLSEVGAAAARHDGIVVMWFDGAAALADYQAWLLTVPGQEVLRAINQVADRDRSPVVVADEVVVRGAEWLDDRWRSGGEQVKHVALARRSPGVSPEELSRRWKAEAGRTRSAAGGVVAIPEPLRGQAYVQNHPVARSTGDWAYDAINEVYFDDPLQLEQRVAWFREHPPAADDGLFRDPCFLVVSEDLLPTSG